MFLIILSAQGHHITYSQEDRLKLIRHPIIVRNHHLNQKLNGKQLKQFTVKQNRASFP